MLELADGTPCQVCISACTFQGRGDKVYGRGTLVLGGNQKLRSWFSALGTTGQPMATNSGHLAFLKLTPMVALHRLSGDRQLGARNCSRWAHTPSGKEFTQVDGSYS